MRKNIALIVFVSLFCCSWGQLPNKEDFKKEMLNAVSQVKPPLNSDEMKITNNKVKEVTRWVYHGVLPQKKRDLESCIYGWFPINDYYVFYYNEETNLQDDESCNFDEYLAVFNNMGYLKDTLHIFKNFDCNYYITCKSFYLKGNGHVLVMTLYDTPEVERIDNIVKPNSYYDKLPPEQAKRERAADFRLQSKLEQGKSDNPKTRYEIVEYMVNVETGKFEQVKIWETGLLDQYKHHYISFEENSPLYKYKEK